MSKFKRLLVIFFLVQTQMLFASDWRLLSIGGTGDKMVYTFGDMQGIVYKDNTAKIWIRTVPYLNVKNVLQKHIIKLTPECERLYSSGYIPDGINSFQMKMDNDSRKTIIKLLIYSELAQKTNEVVPQETSLYEFDVSKKRFRILTSFKPNEVPEVYPASITPPWYYVAPDTVVENIFKTIIKYTPKN